MLRTSTRGVRQARPRSKFRSHSETLFERRKIRLQLSRNHSLSTADWRTSVIGLSAPFCYTPPISFQIKPLSSKWFLKGNRACAVCGLAQSIEFSCLVLLCSFMVPFFLLKSYPSESLQRDHPQNLWWLLKCFLNRWRICVSYLWCLITRLTK